MRYEGSNRELDRLLKQIATWIADGVVYELDHAPKGTEIAAPESWVEAFWDRHRDEILARVENYLGY